MKPAGKIGKLLGNNEQRVARRIICAPTDGVSATFVIDLMTRMSLMALTIIKLGINLGPCE